MAVRLQMKLGVVAEQDRLHDSPDTIVVVEPSVGSVARSKGHLYLLVTSQVPGQRAHEATRLTAETIRNEYYYDESSAIRSSLARAIGLANKRLGHQRERLGLGDPGAGDGPIGVGVAVVRGNELYVATVGPAEAYLVRQARLSTLPDPLRGQGLPTARLQPDVWRGEIAIGDELVLISPNVMERLGLEELKDAAVTLHPQSAMEHIHHRFVAAGGSGSDGAIAFEAAEVTADHRPRFGGRRPDPIEGSEDRAADLVMDPTADGVAALGSGSRPVGTAGNVLERGLVRIQDLLSPPRSARHRRVTPGSTRRETQRRALVALLAFVVVAGGLGLAVFYFPRDLRLGGQPVSSAAIGQQALAVARANLDRVFEDDADLLESDPDEARDLLTEAYEELDRAEAVGISAAAIGPLRADVVDGLNRIFQVVTVDDLVAFSFDPATVPGVDLADIDLGPDGAAYMLDRTYEALWRFAAAEAAVTVALQANNEVGGAAVGAPRLQTVGGQDILVLDAASVLWRLRAGSISQVAINGASDWGDDIVRIGTYTSDARSLYNLYLVDPSQEQIRAYAPAPDGGGFPSAADNWLISGRPMAKVTDMYIDGDIYLADAGAIVRFGGGAIDGWEAEDPGDSLLRDAPRYQYLASASARRDGRIYAFDEAGDRVLAFDKAEGTFIEQYRLPDGNDGWADLRGMYVGEGADGSTTLVWVSADKIHFSHLADASAVPASPDPNAPQSSAPSAPAAAVP